MKKLLIASMLATLALVSGCNRRTTSPNSSSTNKPSPSSPSTSSILPPSSTSPNTSSSISNTTPSDSLSKVLD